MLHYLWFGTQLVLRQIDFKRWNLRFFTKGSTILVLAFNKDQLWVSKKNSLLISIIHHISPQYQIPSPAVWMTIDQPCRKGHILSRSDQSLPLRTSAGHEESCCFRTILLPGPPSSAPGTAIGEEGSNGDRIKAGIPNGKNISVVATLISTSRLPRLLALLSSISTSPPAISDPPPHVVRQIRNKGLGMFARRDIRKGELIVWERPALIVPGLERNEETSQEAYQRLAGVFLEVDGKGVEEIPLGSIDEIREAGMERYEDVRGLAISSSFDGGHWLEGAVRTNALVLEFDDGQGKSKKEKREIYGGVYPLINRCNHSCVPNAAVHFISTLLTSCLYALRDIKIGEEITKTYVNPLLPRERRMQTLRRNYGFECDCQSCVLSSPDSTSSDEKRAELAVFLTTPTFTRWAADLARADDILAEKHRWALRLVEEEQVWAVETEFLEEMAHGCALMGDVDGFSIWARKVVDAGQWVGQVGEFPEGGGAKENERRRKWVWWLEDPQRRVKKWGWRKKMREDMSRRRGVDLEAGVLEGIFGHLEE